MRAATVFACLACGLALGRPAGCAVASPDAAVVRASAIAPSGAVPAASAIARSSAVPAASAAVAAAAGGTASASASAPAPSPTASSATRRNWFNDPFVQATHGLAACPRPDPPLLTAAQMDHEAHYRAERGTSCYRAGRCRLPNAYLYDREIVPRVVKAIHAHGGFEDTSVWVEGQRRWVWLKGCVSTPAQAAELERMTRLIDDVEAVIPQLIVGTTMPAGAPAYRLPPAP